MNNDIYHRLIMGGIGTVYNPCDIIFSVVAQHYSLVSDVKPEKNTGVSFKDHFDRIITFNIFKDLLKTYADYERFPQYKERYSYYSQLVRLASLIIAFQRFSKGLGLLDEQELNKKIN